MSDYKRITDRKIELTDEGVDELMAEYAPTTEEVRDVYQSRLIKIEANIYALIDEDQANAEFDRWLAEVKAEAWQEGYESVTIKTLANPYRQGETE